MATGADRRCLASVVRRTSQPMAPEQRDEAFPLYLVRLIRNRMEEMNAWR
jgi:hypothetical protein